ncbi:ArpU family phage packaging/lysis transcriptional regulator [Macrococcus bovicus]|uniref:ArpU family phage packaging/lysis transcriptional regulator n=1 Tax=Macrococcus bovicus TaxID=69968 RepID=UPI0025A50B5E|nr:ArpU family phage packaging/lysis transcriptional regulator [Macrococcus bovicus]WJP98447.1 ArpU family phage packaging/lysis transcriptional regulator [Macrococcus bovicus]
MVNESTVEIDISATRKEVIKLLKKYKRMLHLTAVRCMPSITSNFDYLPADSSKTLNSLESAAHRNIQKEKLLEERDKLTEMINEAVNHLPPDERYIVVKKYLSEENEIDYNIYTDLGVGKTKYHEIKNQAMTMLAFYLGIEVYKT